MTTTTDLARAASMASYRYADVELSLFDDTKMTVVTLEILDDSPRFGRVPHVISGFHFALSGPQSLRDYLDGKMLQYGATIQWKDGTLEGTVRKPFGKDLKLQLFLAWIEEGFGGLAAVSSTGTFYVFQQGAKKLSKNYDNDHSNANNDSKKKVVLKVSVENDEPKAKGEPYNKKKKELKKKKKEEKKKLKKLAKTAATEMGEVKKSMIKQWIKDVAKSKGQVSPEQQRNEALTVKKPTASAPNTADKDASNNKKELSDRKDQKEVNSTAVGQYNTCNALAAIMTANIRTRSITRQDHDALTGKTPDASATNKQEISGAPGSNDKLQAQADGTETASSSSFDASSVHSLKAAVQDPPTSLWSRFLRRITCCGALE